MAGTGTQRNTSTTFNCETVMIDSIQTTNTTPVLIYTLPVPQNKSFDVSVYQMAVKSDGTSTNSGTTRGVFRRGTGNITQEASLIKNLVGLLTAAGVSFTVNNTNFTIEIYATGTTATTINWNFEITIKNMV